MPDPTSKEIVSEELAREMQNLIDSSADTTEATLMKVGLVFSAAQTLLRDRSARVASEAAKDAEIARLREARRWRKVGEEKPPVDGGLVLAHFSYSDVGIECQDVSQYADTEPLWADGTITHWMPLPDPPQESKP